MKRIISIVLVIAFLSEQTLGRAPLSLSYLRKADSSALRPIATVVTGSSQTRYKASPEINPKLSSWFQHSSGQGGEKLKFQLRLAIVAKLMKEFELGSDLDSNQRQVIEEKLAREYLTAILTEQELGDFLLRFKESKKPISELESFLQRDILDYFLANTSKILREVKDDVPLEKQKVHELFMAGIRVYKFPLIKDLLEKRKKLLTYFILLNIHPHKDKIGSPVRSDEARRLMINEVFASEDVTIFEPALETVIELLAKGEELHSDYFFRCFYPLFEASEKLPRFAKAIIDVLIEAEHNKVRLFEIKSEGEFFKETKKIIRQVADESPSVKEEIIEYLQQTAAEHKEEIPLVRNLLNRLQRPFSPYSEEKSTTPKTARQSEKDKISQAVEQIKVDKHIKNYQKIRPQIEDILRPRIDPTSKNGKRILARLRKIIILHQDYYRKLVKGFSIGAGVIYTLLVIYLTATLGVSIAGIILAYPAGLFCLLMIYGVLGEKSDVDFHYFIPIIGHHIIVVAEHVPELRDLAHELGHVIRKALRLKDRFCFFPEAFAQLIQGHTPEGWLYAYRGVDSNIVEKGCPAEVRTELIKFIREIEELIRQRINQSGIVKVGIEGYRFAPCLADPIRKLFPDDEKKRIEFLISLFKKDKSKLTPSFTNKTHAWLAENNIPEEKARIFTSRKMRLFDIIGAGLLVIPAIFIIVISGFFIKITSKGPVFVKQIRVGHKGKPIRIWKLRTMKDEKVTSAGKFLRITGLDEMPQVFHILQGSMSVFGPRPTLRDELDDEYINTVMQIRKPGFFGLYQAKVGAGKGKTDFKKLKEWDLYEIKNFSIWLMIKIFWLTCKKITKDMLLQYFGVKVSTQEALTPKPSLEKESLLPYIRHSRKVVDKVKKKLIIEVVIPVFRDIALLPPDKNPDGKDAVRITVDQLKELFDDNPNIEWRLTFVDDGGPRDIDFDGQMLSAGEIVKRLLKENYSELYDSGKVKVKSLQKAIDENLNQPKDERNPVLEGLKNAEKDSKKGGAVVYGMWEAIEEGADFVVVIDADESTDRRQIGLLMEPVLQGEVDTVIGSRHLPTSFVMGRSLGAKSSSKIYNWFVRIILLLIKQVRRIRDTQCGFKLFTRRALYDILPDSRDKKGSFDAELLALADMKGYRIKEIGIHWVESAQTSAFNIIKDGWYMFCGLFRLWLRILKELVQNQKSTIHQKISKERNSEQENEDERRQASNESPDGDNLKPSNLTREKAPDPWRKEKRALVKVETEDGEGAGAVIKENKKPEEAKLNENAAHRVLRILYGEPEREFGFEEIKKKIGFEITDDELQLVLNDLCKKGYVVKIEDRLPALIEGFIKAIRQPEPGEMKKQTLMQKYGKSLLAILYVPGSTPKDTSHTKTEFQNLIPQMRKNYKQMKQSYIANTPVNRNTVANQQSVLLERIAGRKFDRDKIDKQFAHKLLEYITSSKLAGPSLEDFAEFMGMELGKLPEGCKLPRPETSTGPQSINDARCHLSFEGCA